MEPDGMLGLFKQTGEDLFRQGLTTTHGGNLSVRNKQKIAITAHFAMLGRLKPGDVVEVPLDEPEDRIAGHASSDTPLHQLIYRSTSALAVIHAHGAPATALSLSEDVIAPTDVEGAVFLRQVPVVAPDQAREMLPRLLKTHACVMVRGHGSYTAGRSLGEALAFTSALDFSSRVSLLRINPGQRW